MLSLTKSSSDFYPEREERMKASDGASEAALERSLAEWIPADPVAAKMVLIEAKQILNKLGIVFFLRQGTCLGAIRDHGFIPWDDDLDLGSVFGLHGFSEKSVDRVVAAFRENGFFAKVEHHDQYIYVPMIKSAVRVDWTCYRILDDSIFHYPGVRLPVRLFTNLKEIEFLEEKFNVPNPPEEYLLLKYGEEWVGERGRGTECCVELCVRWHSRHVIRAIVRDDSISPAHKVWGQVHYQGAVSFLHYCTPKPSFASRCGTVSTFPPLILMARGAVNDTLSMNTAL